MPAFDPALRDLEVLVVDCQSTGASPAHGHLLELGWARARAASPTAASITARLVELPDGGRIPAAVRRITGVGEGDMLEARPAAEVWRELVTEIERGAAQPVPTVIHFARFEEPFLRDLTHRHRGEEAPFPFDIVCTHEIGRRVLPDLPRLGLRALAGFFGHRAEELKRSCGHVEATVFVWHHLVTKLKVEHGITRVSELRQWLGAAAPPRGSVREYPMPRSKRLGLPDTPGVYRFLDSAGHLLYVGKATSLRRRVNSYFQKQRGVSERALEMLTQARDLDVTPVATPLEAALLETDEIKRHAPPYNRALVGSGRGVWFLDPALLAAVPRASGRHSVGPFGGRALPRAFEALARVLVAAPEHRTDADLHAVLLGRSLEGLPARECFEEGLRRFEAEAVVVVGERRDLGALLILGHVRWPEISKAGDDEGVEVVKVDEVDEETDGDDGEAPTWDPQRVCDALVDLCARFAHERRRARWLVRLSESTIVFTVLSPAPVVRRMLHVRGGQVLAEGYLATDAPLPIPADHRRSLRARRRAFDLAMLDRLRVLTTELRRVLGAGQEVRIRFGPAAELAGERLRRALSWL